MIDWSSDLGTRALERLRSETIIWLTTVTARGVPQPRPVWFLWDADTILILSMPDAKKVEHIAHNPQVALNFNSAADGDDIQVLLATATTDPAPLPAAVRDAYLEKYREDIPNIGMTPEQMLATYSMSIRAVPTRLRSY